MKVRIVTTVTWLVLASSMAAAPPDHSAQMAASSRSVDNDSYINANNILMFVTNRGGFGRDLDGVFGHDAGTYFPYQTIEQIENGELASYALYAAGLWMGGQVNGETRVTVAEFSSEYVPGPMAGGTYQPDDPSFKIYQLYSDSLADFPNGDYLNWPADQGAPVNPDGTPAMLGDQMLWTVFNDADPAQHTNGAGETAPLGIEVQQTVWAVDEAGDDTVLVSHEVPVDQSGTSAVVVTVYSGHPSEQTGHTYAVETDVDEILGRFWRLRDLTTGMLLMGDQTDFSGETVFDVGVGFSFTVFAPEPGFARFEVVANAAGPLNPPVGAAADWSGFPGSPPDETQQVGPGRWLFHTADNGGTSGGGDRSSYESFVARTLRDGLNSQSLGTYDYEMRFTGSNDNPGVGGSLAIEWYGANNVFWVPFELWNIGDGTPDDPSDDFQMFAHIIDDAGLRPTQPGDNTYALESWGVEALGGGDLEHSVSGWDDDPFTDWVYWINPPDMSPGTAGYDAIGALFLAGTYAGEGEEVMARTVLVNWNGDEFADGNFNQDCPEKGTIFRITTHKELVADVFTFVPEASTIYSTGPRDASVYIKYLLHNKGGNTINDLYFSLWTDPDLGGAGDDLVGCDTLHDVFFVYNDNLDQIYGAYPPALGFKIIHGPLVYSPGNIGNFDGTLLPDYANLPMTAFQQFVNGTDPNSFVEVYNYMQGLDATGSPLPNGTRYAYPGDPVAGTGDLDTQPSDKRMMASCGPIDLNPGESQYMLIRMSVGQGMDRLESVTKVKEYLADGLPEESCFEHASNTENSYAIVIDDIVLTGDPIAPGDEVGVFDGDLCVGSAVFEAFPMPVAAWEDETSTPEQDGYVVGNSMRFRVARQQGCDQTKVCATPEDYSVGDGLFGTGALARLELSEGDCCQPPELLLNAGWNFVSSNAAPADPSMPAILYSLGSEIDIIKAADGRFWVPGISCPMPGWLCEWDVLQSYKIHMRSDQSLVMTGECAGCDTPIDLAEGWNWPSYMPDVGMCPDAALTSVLNCLAIVKEGGSLFWVPGIPCPTPGWLNEMIPGNGYAVYMDCPATLTYTCDRQKSSTKVSQRGATTVSDNHFGEVIRNTGDYHAIVIDRSELLQPGDEIGVFASTGLLVGSGLYTGEKLPIAAWVDDPQTPTTDGGIKGDRFSVRVWQGDLGEELACDFAVLSGSEMFCESPFSLIRLGAVKTTELLPRIVALANYPNPFNASTTIVFSLSVSSPVEIDIYNLLGRRVANLAAAWFEAGEHAVAWDGRDTEGTGVASGVYFYRIGTSYQTETRKMLLLK